MFEKQVESISLANNKNFLNALRFSCLDFSSAVGELIDNSLDAGAGEIHIDVNTNRPGNKDAQITEVMVCDDGKGVSASVLQKCLVLGERCCQTERKGIGRFGLGLLRGGLAVSKRIEIYSRTDEKSSFWYTYLELDGEKQGEIPCPVENEPPSKALEYLNKSAGTVVVLSGCDELLHSEKVPEAKQTINLQKYIARTYRKFIGGGIRMYLHSPTHDGIVRLHDPLYQMGPTEFDERAACDPKALRKFYKNFSIPLPLSESNETAEISVTITLLPEEWRRNYSDGFNEFAYSRRISENNGISVLRAHREIFYGDISQLYGGRSKNECMPIDRWWGCEISFPPELDFCFFVGYEKNRVHLGSSLRDKMKSEVTPVIRYLRQEIVQGFRVQAEKEALEGKGLTAVLNQYAKSISGMEEKLKIKSVILPQNILFEPEHGSSESFMLLNTAHPYFRQYLLTAYCNMQLGIGAETNAAFLEAFTLFAAGLCRAEETLPEQGKETMAEFCTMWMTILGQVSNEYNIPDEAEKLFYAEERENG